MRISKLAKEENRRKILHSAKILFQEKGFEKTTTRDIAAVMNMATGTLFNYFDSKNTLAMTLIMEALGEGKAAYLRRRTGEEAFTEDLFLLISSELRSMKPYKAFIGPVLESAMSQFSKSSSNPHGENVRQNHLDLVKFITEKHGVTSASSPIALNLYWTLYLGILACWSKDESKNQEETLAFIDYALNIFYQTFSERNGL